MGTDLVAMLSSNQRTRILVREVEQCQARTQMLAAAAQIQRLVPTVVARRDASSEQRTSLVNFRSSPSSHFRSGPSFYGVGEE